MTHNQAIAELKTKIHESRIIEVVAAPVLQPRELFLQIGRKRHQVESIEQAVTMHNQVRDASGLGASGMPRVTIVDRNGTHLYGISYNGRVWDGDRPLDGVERNPEWQKQFRAGAR